MTKLTNLTIDQQAQFPIYRDRWLQIGLDCSPFNREAAEAAVKMAYRCAKLPEPKIFIHLGSPLQGCIGAHMLKNRDQVRAQVRNQVWAQVRDQVWGQVRRQVAEQVRDQVWDQVGDQVRRQVSRVRDQVWTQVWDQVGDQIRHQVRDQVWRQVAGRVESQVWAQVGDQVGDQVRRQVWEQVRDQVSEQVSEQVWDQVADQVRNACYGSHDANWMSYLNYFQEVCNIPGLESSDGIVACAKECGWWWPFNNVAVITPKPVVLQRDEEHWLHCATGPAMVYPDGWEIWALHGKRVEPFIHIMPNLRRRIVV